MRTEERGEGRLHTRALVQIVIGSKAYNASAKAHGGRFSIISHHGVMKGGNNDRLLLALRAKCNDCEISSNLTDHFWIHALR